MVSRCILCQKYVWGGSMVLISFLACVLLSPVPNCTRNSFEGVIQRSLQSAFEDRVCLIATVRLAKPQFIKVRILVVSRSAFHLLCTRSLPVKKKTSFNEDTAQWRRLPSQTHWGLLPPAINLSPSLPLLAATFSLQSLFHIFKWLIFPIKSKNITVLFRLVEWFLFINGQLDQILKNTLSICRYLQTLTFFLCALSHYLLSFFLTGNVHCRRA